MLKEKTTLFFRILYFATAMLPSYFIFFIYYFKTQKSIITYLILFIIFSILITLFLKHLIFNEVAGNRKNIIIDNPKAINPVDNNILLTMIFPLFLNHNNVGLMNAIIFIFIQTLYYNIYINSSELLLNIPLILAGVNYIKIDDNHYLLANKNVDFNKKYIISDICDFLSVIEKEKKK